MKKAKETIVQVLDKTGIENKSRWEMVQLVCSALSKSGDNI